MFAKLRKLRKHIFKKSKKTELSNYSSISLLSVISMTIKKAVHDQTNAFLSDEIYFTTTSLALEQIIQ